MMSIKQITKLSFATISGYVGNWNNSKSLITRHQNKHQTLRHPSGKKQCYWYRKYNRGQQNLGIFVSAKAVFPCTWFELWSFRGIFCQCHQRNYLQQHTLVYLNCTLLSDEINLHIAGIDEKRYLQIKAQLGIIIVVFAQTTHTLRIRYVIRHMRVNTIIPADDTLLCFCGLLQISFSSID